MVFRARPVAPVRPAIAAVLRRGGPQRGGNVFSPSLQRHAFNSFGSATFLGVPTFLTKDFLVDPEKLLWEAQRLEEKGVKNPLELLRIDRACGLVLPLHIMLNQMKELERAEKSGPAERHGSIGYGIYEAFLDTQRPDQMGLLAADLFSPDNLNRKLSIIVPDKIQQAQEILDRNPRSVTLRMKFEQFCGPSASFSIPALTKTIRQNLQASGEILRPYVVDDVVQIVKNQAEWIDVVVGLGFGDEGKAIAVSFLASLNNPEVSTRIPLTENLRLFVRQNPLKYRYDESTQTLIVRSKMSWKERKILRSLLPKKSDKKKISQLYWLSRRLPIRTSRIICEGNQGALLDAQHGIFPYVTAFNVLANDVAQTLGQPTIEALKQRGPQVRVLGVTRFPTSHSIRPLPTKISIRDYPEALLRRLGEETSGLLWPEDYEVGWPDLVLLKYGITLNNPDELFLTNLDRFSNLAKLFKVSKIPVCVGYNVKWEPTRLARFFDFSVETNGLAKITNFKAPDPDNPLSEAERLELTEILRRVTPIYEYLDGWEDISKARFWQDLPEAARRYVEFIEDKTGKPVRYISVGPLSNQQFLVLK